MSKFLISTFLFITLLNYSDTSTDNKFTDSRDGTQYSTIKIGNQVWMSENLKFKTEGAISYDNNDENMTCIV